MEQAPGDSGGYHVQKASKDQDMCPKDAEHPESFSRKFWYSNNKSVDGVEDDPECWNYASYDQHKEGNWHGQEERREQSPFRPTSWFPGFRIHARPLIG